MPLIVYAVMRGTQLVELYADKIQAAHRAIELDKTYKRGKRYTVYPITVK